MDVTFKVEEQNRNQFTFGGGVSGYEGAFLNATSPPRTSWRRRDVPDLAADAASGPRTTRCRSPSPTSSTAPSPPASTSSGARSPYPPYYNVVGYSQESTGLSLVRASWSASGRGRSSTTPTRSSTSARSSAAELGTTRTTQLRGGSLRHRATTRSSSATCGKRPESRVTPNLVYNTVDNPYTPRAGMRHTRHLPCRRAGRSGGTVNYFRPEPRRRSSTCRVGRKMPSACAAEVRLHRAVRRHEGAACYQRYFLGGETQVRGYHIRTIGPPTRGRAARAATSSLLFNAEYYFDVFGPLRALLFFDAGQAFLEGEHDRPRASSACPPGPSCASSCPSSTCLSGSSTP